MLALEYEVKDFIVGERKSSLMSKEAFIRMTTNEDEQVGYFSASQAPSQNQDSAKVTLPCEYGEDGAVLLIRDPYWACAYWEISLATEEAMRAKLGTQFEGAQVLLRIYEFKAEHPDEVTQVIDVPVKMRVGSWYLHLGNPGHQFQCEIGYLLTSRSFISITKSNRIELPPDDISRDLDAEDWAIVEEDFQLLFQTIKKEIGTSSLESFVLREEWLKTLKSRLHKEMASGIMGSPGLRL